MPLPSSAASLLGAAAVAGVLLCAHVEAADGGATARQAACVDPVTGRLVSPDERPECRALLDRGAVGQDPAGRPGQSAEGVQEQRLPDGSAKIDLEGRFRQQGGVPPAANTPPTPPRGGRVAIIDPRTGQLLTAEAGALLRRLEPRAAPLQAFEVQLRESLSASQDVGGLEEQRLQAGAVKIDLEGRFRSPLVARIGPDSHVAVRHEAAPAAE